MLSVRAAESLQYLVNVDYGSAIIGTAEHSSGEVFQTISIPGMYNSVEENEPSIPVKYIKFEVPEYVNNFKVTITSSTLNRTFSLSEPLMPLEAFTTNEALDGVSKEVVFGQGYTSSPKGPTARVSDEYFVNGYRHFVVVEVRPMVYRHDALRIDCYSSIGIKLEYCDCTASGLKFRPIKSNNIQNVQYVDENSIALKSPKLTQSKPSSNLMTLYIHHYVFITPASLKNSLKRLANWKRQKGYEVTIKTVEEILSDNNYAIGVNSKCFDKESAVREWLRDFYNDNGAFYCLLVGDFNTSAPIRKYKCQDPIHDKEQEPDWTDPTIEEYVPSDNYFADLISDWDYENKNAGIYYVKDISKASFSPTIPVGRLICSTAEHVNNFTDKVILYEMYPGKGNSSYLTKGFVVKHQDFFRRFMNDYPTILSYTGKISVTTLKSNYAEKHLYLRPLANEVINGMKEAGIYSLQGHGGTSRIHFAEVLDTTGIWPQHRSILAREEYKDPEGETKWDNGGGLDMLKNPTAPAIAYSWACSIAPYDGRYEQPDHVYNMASSFTVAGKYGGPAFMANTRVGYFGYSNVLENNFAKYIEDDLTIGLIENNSKSDYQQSGLHPNFVKFTHNIIGDSELKIWTANPDTLSGKVLLGKNKITFDVADEQYRFGVRDGSRIYRHGVIKRGDEFKIDLFKNAINNQYAVVHIESDKHLPQTFIVTTGEAIEEDAGYYTFRDVKFSDLFQYSISESYIQDYSAYLNIGKNGRIGVFAFNSITSDTGINVGKGGQIELQCEHDVTLKGDTVASGGHMFVKGKTVTFEKGFSVAAGGTLSVNL